jgi:hypothetical protein
MPINLRHKTDTTESPGLWHWFWLLVFGVVVLTLIAMAAIANRAEDHLAPGPDWPQCCDHWKGKRVSTSNRLFY